MKDTWFGSLFFHISFTVLVTVFKLVTCVHHFPASSSFDQVFKQPWPGVMRTVYGNHQRFETTYFKKFPGYYVTGDGERRLSVLKYNILLYNTL